MVALAEQIEVFDRLRPQLRRDHGSAWAVFVGDEVKAAFVEFESAAHYAVDNFPGQQLLIRHTDETREALPFLVIER